MEIYSYYSHLIPKSQYGTELNLRPTWAMAKIIQLSDSSGNLYPRTSVGALTSSNALNDINFEGTFWCNAVGGRPQTTNTYAWLFVRNYGESCYQEYIPYSTSGVQEIYMRYFVSGNGWSVWRKITTSAV